jgi:hypothetical protein
MPTSARTLPGACREHVDLINQALAAGNDEQAFYLAFQYFRARAKHIQARRREQDADGFRRYAAHWLASLAGQIHDHKPDDDYRFASPLIPGGDWRP